MGFERIRELGAEVRFDCPACGREVVTEIGGPGDDHFASGECPNSDCDRRFSIRLEAETE